MESEQEVKKVETTDAKEIMKEDVVEEQQTNEDKHVVVEHGECSSRVCNRWPAGRRTTHRNEKLFIT